MPFFPTLEESYTIQQMTDSFRGYNHNLKIDEGEFYEMENLTYSYYPLLANRGKRGIVSSLNEPRGMLAKAKLAYIDGSKLYYDGLDISSYLEAKGLFISSAEKMLPKQLLSMGAYIIIYPDKLYINTENYTDCGSIEASFSSVEGSEVVFTMTKADGSEYEDPTISETEPEEPENGDLWIDTSEDVHGLKQYSSTSGMWVSIATVYTKISCPGIGASFEKYDGVTISGCSAAGESVWKQIDMLNGSHVIYDRGDDFIMVIGVLDQTYTQKTGTVKVSRDMPDLDFITEAENRLWGCKYGLVNGETVNEIYCCALGDFKNWNRFLGIATDSYVASVGTDGPWTGAVTYLGHPIFFKENVLHKVYISSTGAHQIQDTACRGVQKGSHQSLVVVNEILYYKSVTDVCAYDGSMPVSASPQFGGERYYDAVAGSLGAKYYISMRDADDKWHLFVYDSLRGFWHREDNTHALCFARCGEELYFMDAGDETLKCITGSVGELEDAEVKWSATTGIIGYGDVNQKYISRFNLRMILPPASEINIYIQYDSDGSWIKAGQIQGRGTGSFSLPLRPRRCDHFRLKITGSGQFRLYSIVKIIESGSDY